MNQPHIFFLPLMAHGHLIPMLELAKLFSSRGVRTTIISNPAFSEPIVNAQESGFDIGLKMIKFPPRESGLPDHMVSLTQFITDELIGKFAKAVDLLQEPVEKFLQESNPSCIVSDMFWTWTVDTAAKFGIPRLLFHGTGFLPMCASEQMWLHKPYKKVFSDFEPFLLPNLPHQLRFVRTQVPEFQQVEIESHFSKLLDRVRESDQRSYGVIVNSFYELEPDYSDHFKKVLGRKAWSIGPLLLWNNGDEERAQRGKKSAIDAQECLTWLDSKKPNSVVYMCFGSMGIFTHAQLHETAKGIEASGQDFIWVTSKGENEDKNEDDIPEGFEERTKGKGIIIRGWAPQVMILNHPSIGAFVTHCGWNSMLEAVCAGVPMVTWPLCAEQFFNEKLVTEVLKIGVPVGSKKWQQGPAEGVPGEALTEAIRHIMVGEAYEMRFNIRAKTCKEMARTAVEEGGSSYKDLSALIAELEHLKHM
ncbi:scopoletin glucosyltransferase-like [Primulina huaijiensis]|uniref:scopoletin glucosyltransferase-like n=1 Tax=Primulina huaijiensis TaxID=1492673 RepID=UPI003CC71837